VTEGEALAGRCLCGAVTFTARPREWHASVCHCRMCQRWNGGMPVSVLADDLVFGGDAPAVYRSSPWGERIFCRTCGSSLAWRMQDGSMTAVAAAAFDGPLDLPVTEEIFIDEKPAGYALAGDHRRMTGEEVMALFAATPPAEPRVD